MAYNLENTFPRTYRASTRANGSSQAILNKFPYVCSREALYKSIDDSNVAGDSQRNPNSYTVRQITDKICEYWDDIMYFSWARSDVYKPTAFGNTPDSTRWDQRNFWQNGDVSFIALYRETFSAPVSAAILLAETDIVLLPGKYYSESSKEYITKPFLGFDTEATHNFMSDSYADINQDDFAVELDLTNNRVTGITSGGTQIDPSIFGIGPGTAAHNNVQLLAIYDNNVYHPDLSPYGGDFKYNPSYSGHDNLATSNKWYDLRTAKFSVTISGGEVTAITPESRLDGDGASITGGWAYRDHQDYQELYFVLEQPLDVLDVMPRVLFRTNTDQPGYSGSKATVSISGDENEFFPGIGLETDEIVTAYAVQGLGDKGYGYTETLSIDTEWYQLNQPHTVYPNNVRMSHERPALTTTTRSLKSKTVSTGAHRISWEFEYPPMTQSEAEDYINFFEELQGNKECQIYVPRKVMTHVEDWGYNKSGVSGFMYVRSGNKGDQQITLDGHEPGSYDKITNNTYINIHNKTYRILKSQGGPVDQYGRATYQIEPSLLSDAAGTFVRSNSGGFDLRRDFYLMKAKIVDDTLDYTIDAAGLYRITMRFTEAL